MFNWRKTKSTSLHGLVGHHKSLMLIEPRALIGGGYAQLLSQVRVGVGRKDTGSCRMEVVLVVAALCCWCCFLHLNESGVYYVVLFGFL